ncbi:MAG TPA: HEPN domain-containing protein [Puia sp.]|jgi:hypothetical protein
MQRAYDQFIDSMKYVKELDSLYLYLTDTLHLPNDLTDLLRAEWVYSVSALDKLIHDLIRIGMVDAFQGNRTKTRKFLSFGITMDTHTNITAISTSGTYLPPPEYWFEQEIIQKHKLLSFQEPEKIADGLSLIWEEPHKWQKIATTLGVPMGDLTTRLKAIIARRNQIVHEADHNILTGTRNNIEKSDIDVVVPFMERIAIEIFDSVK